MAQKPANLTFRKPTKCLHFTGVVGAREYNVKITPQPTQSYVDAIREQVKDLLVRNHLLNFFRQSTAVAFITALYQ